MINPKTILSIKDKAKTFETEHPKMRLFFDKINKEALTVGSTFEIKVTAVDGKEYVANIKVSENDVELIKLITQLH